MTAPALIINTPTKDTLAKLQARLDSGELVDGMATLWCPASGTHLVAVAERGVIVHWQLEPAGDAETAEALARHYWENLRAFARAAVSTLRTPCAAREGKSN